MNGKQRTEITFETHEKIIVRVSENHSAMWFCIYCLKNVRPTESTIGALLICQNSLLKPADDSD